MDRENTVIEVSVLPVKTRNKSEKNESAKRQNIVTMPTQKHRKKDFYLIEVYYSFSYILSIVEPNQYVTGHIV